MSKYVSEEERHVVFSVTMPKRVLAEVDKTRGFMPRSTWLRAVALSEIKRQKEKALLQGLTQATNQNASQATIRSGNNSTDNNPTMTTEQVSSTTEVASTVGI